MAPRDPPLPVGTSFESHARVPFTGEWVCVRCGAQMKATAYNDDLGRPPCPSCLVGSVIPERRSAARREKP